MNKLFRNHLFFIFFVGLLAGCQPTVKKPNINTVASAKGTAVYQPDWENIAQHYTFPEWFCDAKFGIFIHWGIYSVPAFGTEWYARNMYIEGSPEFEHHRKTYGDQSVFGYKDFIPMFKAEKFDADEWAEVFKASGAQYVVPVAEHHDGFALYASDLNPYNSVAMGPKKDIVGLLKEAVEKREMIFGLSSHRAENAWFYNGGMKFPSDVQDTTIALYGGRLPGESVDDRFMTEWLERTYELVDKYKPQLMWFDWTVNKPGIMPYFNKYMAYYYNNAIDWDNGGVVINTKYGYPDNIQVWDVERGKSDRMKKYPWQTDTSIGKKSWSFVDDEENKTPEQIIHDLVDIVSKNGNLLLNIGPRADGSITEEQIQVLRSIGEWLKINGEAIYGTRTWITSGEGSTEGTSGAFTDNTATQYTSQDIRFTTKGCDLFATCLAWTEGKVLITSFAENKVNNLKIKAVHMIGSQEEIQWSLTSEGLEIQFPKEKPCQYAYVFKIQLEGQVQGPMYMDYSKTENVTIETTTYNHSDKEEEVTISLLLNEKETEIQKVILPAGRKKDINISIPQNPYGKADISILLNQKKAYSTTILLPNISLAGDWKFQKGDDLVWKNIDYSDASWEVVKLPENWEDHSNYLEDQTFGWYRKTITIPSDWKGLSIELPLGQIDDVDETYFNGVSIGKSGTFPPNYKTAFSKKRVYSIPSNLIKYGEPNVIAVRVYDDGNEGGILGPIGAVQFK